MADPTPHVEDSSASDITDILGPPPSNPPYSDSEPGKVAPHVTTFGMVLNTVARTYSYRYDEALRHLPSNALAMRRDCYLTSLLNERALPTARRKWQLEVDNDQDARQKLVKDGLTKSIKAIRHYTKFRFYLTKGALWYGRYGSQGVWTRKDLAGEALWTFDRHAPVNGDKIQFGWDSVPRVMIQALAAQSYPQGSVVYGDRAPLLKLERPDWRRQFVIHKHEVDDADYFEGEMAGGIHGVGIRSQIYWAWWLRDEMLGWAVDFMQKVGTMGLLVFWYEQGNKEAKAQAEANAKLASSRSVLVMPRPAGKDSQTWGVEQVQASTGGIDALKAMIEDYFERHMERLIVGQSMSSGGRDTQSIGGSGRADLAADTKYQLLAFDADNLDETLTADMIDVAKQLNYPWADFPVRHKSIVPDPEKENRLKGLTTIWDRLPVRTEDVYEAADAITPGDDDEVVGGEPQGPQMPGDPDFGGGEDPPLGGVLGDGPLDDNTGDDEGWDDEAPKTYAADSERATDGRFGRVAGQHGKGAGKPPGGNRPRNAKGHPLNRESFREAVGNPERAAEIRAKLPPEEQAKFDGLIRESKARSKVKRGTARETKAQSLADETAKVLQANAGALNRAGMYGVAEAVQRGLLTLQLAGTKEQAMEAVKDCERRVSEARKSWKEQDRKAADVIVDDDRFAGLSRSDQRAVRTAVSLELREMRANMPELEIGDVRSAVRSGERDVALSRLHEAFDSAADPGVTLTRMDDALSDPDSVGLGEFGPNIDPDADDIPRIQAKLKRAGIEPPADDGHDPWDYWDGAAGDAVQAKKDQIARNILAAIRQHYGLPGRDDTPQTYAAAHAPAGGVLIGGQFFTGGEFIPGDVMAKASPMEKAKVGEFAPAGGGGKVDGVKGKSDKPAHPADAPGARRLSRMPETLDEAKALGWAAREEVIGEDKKAEPGDCIPAAAALSSLSPDIEVWDGTYPGDWEEGGYHFIVKAGKYFIDITSDQFDGPPVRVFTEDSKTFDSYYRRFSPATKASTTPIKVNATILDTLADYDHGAGLVGGGDGVSPSQKNKLSEEYSFTDEQIDSLMADGSDGDIWKEFHEDIEDNDPDIAESLKKLWAKKD